MEQSAMETAITLDDLIEDLVAVEPLLLNYEKKYRVHTPDFCKLYKQMSFHQPNLSFLIEEVLNNLLR
jgi:hypothetical protein